MQSEGHHYQNANNAQFQTALPNHQIPGDANNASLKTSKPKINMKESQTKKKDDHQANSVTKKDQPVRVLNRNTPMSKVNIFSFFIQFIAKNFFQFYRIPFEYNK